MLTVDSKLFRGPRPSVQALKAVGITAVISLESGWHEFLHGEMYEEDEELQAAGIAITHIPVSPFALPPTRAQVQAFLHALTVYRVLDATVYFHCEKGVDRTGFMAACYRVLKQGQKVDWAMDEWKRDGFHWLAYFTWPWQFKRLMAQGGFT